MSQQEIGPISTEGFVAALTESAMPNTFNSIFDALSHGDAREKSMGTLFAGLDEVRKEQVLDLVAYSIASSLFGFLVILDNCRAIEDLGDKGEYQLVHARGGISARLGAPPDFLHDNLPDFWQLVDMIKCNAAMNLRR